MFETVTVESKSANQEKEKARRCDNKYWLDVY